ncbi:MAG: Gfo/Idh/MocA family oxidoreductase [Pirellulaceae bacterium]
MIKVGLAGIGFMGWMHWLAYQRVEGIEVVAIASSDPQKRSGDWRGIKGNFGPPGEVVDLQGITTVENYDELLSIDEIDVIDICLPPAAHPALALQTAAATKHVFCEKPLALNVADAQKMVDSCRKANVTLSVGHVLPFFPEYKWAREQIDSGKYGALLGGTFKRVISNPEWIPDFYKLDKVGGPLVDLHVHDAHLIRFLFGLPTKVFSVGRMNGEAVEYASSSFVFDSKDLVVSSVMGWCSNKGDRLPMVLRYTWKRQPSISSLLAFKTPARRCLSN